MWPMTPVCDQTGFLIKPAVRERFPGGTLTESSRKRSLIKSIKGKSESDFLKHTHAHAHTRQTNHYIAHLQVDYQIGTTVHIVEIRPYLWSHFNSFFPPPSLLSSCVAEILQFFPRFTLFLQQQHKGQIL